MRAPAPRFLLVRSGERTCALALEHVVETFRPLPVERLAGAPELVTGVTVVRGEPVPVVDLARLLSGAPSEAVSRYVVLRCGDRRAALAVDAVLGVGTASGGAPAPLLEGACGGAVAALAAADRTLLVVLEAARLVPEEAWRALSVPGVPA